ncbi:MAG TPA: hypothetical protein VEM58_02775, partial [Streptosporangiaceae bacterium]|nr:hypothetical protein [Streptosporangiaceae bacterium]
MGGRPDSATGTIAPDGGVTVAQRRRLAWWRLRSWRQDVEVLARVRDGLARLPGDPDEDGAPASGLTPSRKSATTGESGPRCATTEEPRSASDEAPSQSPEPAIAAIRQTFASVEAAGDEGIAYFYARLFVASPELREL